MKQLLRQLGCRCCRSSPGITMTELVVVVAIMGILSAMALPSFLQWRNNLVFRDTARDMTSLLRRAKSEAIATNLEHRVEIDPLTNPQQFYTRRGNVSVGANFDGDFVNIPMPVDIIRIPPQVGIVTPGNVMLKIVFRPNGTTDVGTGGVQVQLQNAGVTRYWVDVAQTGRVRVCAQWPSCP